MTLKVIMPWLASPLRAIGIQDEVTSLPYWSRYKYDVHWDTWLFLTLTSKSEDHMIHLGPFDYKDSVLKHMNYCIIMKILVRWSHDSLNALALVILSPTFVKFKKFVIIDLKSNIKWDLTRQIFKSLITFSKSFSIRGLMLTLYPYHGNHTTGNDGIYMEMEPSNCIKLLDKFQ